MTLHPLSAWATPLSEWKRADAHLAAAIKAATRFDGTYEREMGACNAIIDRWKLRRVK